MRRRSHSRETPAMALDGEVRRYLELFVQAAGKALEDDDGQTAWALLAALEATCGELQRHAAEAIGKEPMPAWAELVGHISEQLKGRADD